MKKVLLVVVSVLFVGACAGNPPAWWNPNNRYGSTEQQTPKAVPVRSNTTPVVKEETIEPLPDNSYEEITLTPMQDEEGENASGLAASQNEDLLQDNTLPAPAQQPQDLPAPSVLESL